jgi:uncharacterized protein (UPF0264 family)
MTGLLVSVRSAAEAVAALEGGADLIDVKEPSRGSLGRADDETVRAVVEVVAGRRPVSAALGELLDDPEPRPLPGVTFVKWGLSGCNDEPTWQERWDEACTRWRQFNPGCAAVAVAYADWHRPGAPLPGGILCFAESRGLPAVLIDTWNKDGGTLLDWLECDYLEFLSQYSRKAGVKLALAGSLTAKEIEQLRGLAPDWFAVRGAACRGGRELAALLHS